MHAVPSDRKNFINPALGIPDPSSVSKASIVAYPSPISSTSQFDLFRLLNQDLSSSAFRPALPSFLSRAKCGLHGLADASTIFQSKLPEDIQLFAPSGRNPRLHDERSIGINSSKGESIELAQLEPDIYHHPTKFSPDVYNPQECNVDCKHEFRPLPPLEDIGMHWRDIDHCQEPSYLSVNHGIVTGSDILHTNKVSSHTELACLQVKCDSKAPTSGRSRRPKPETMTSNCDSKASEARIQTNRYTTCLQSTGAWPQARGSLNQAEQAGSIRDAGVSIEKRRRSTSKLLDRLGTRSEAKRARKTALSGWKRSNKEKHIRLSKGLDEIKDNGPVLEPRTLSFSGVGNPPQSSLTPSTPRSPCLSPFCSSPSLTSSSSFSSASPVSFLSSSSSSSSPSSSSSSSSSSSPSPSSSSSISHPDVTLTIVSEATESAIRLGGRIPENPEMIISAAAAARKSGKRQLNEATKALRQTMQSMSSAKSSQSK
ncbi:unnamed protein product [Protopolystoma xenopodis]|uniref:Uncharacterized protein n=1 Tax=Protopolystoma xenopodis TaxID=117903 RepID=A0A3S5FD94_9PLAT|nr:unnamed protein product [Protopolystoma xenopodis]